MTYADTSPPLPCVHCGECARECPEALDPEALYFALAADAWPQVRAGRLDACTECNRCTEVCPSHIPLLDWLRWGKSELRRQEQSAELRARFLARNQRLALERALRAAPRPARDGGAPAPAQDISQAEVLAAIARGRARRR